MQKLIFTNSRGQSIELTNSAPFLLESFNPDPAEATILTTKSPGQDGESHMETLLEPRVLTIVIAILGNNSEDMFRKRRELNKVFNPKLTGTLQYINSAGEYSINCIVQTVTPDEKTEPAQEFQIQLYCPNPYWKDVQELREEIALWMGDFEFPLEIPEDTGIEMGHRVSNLIVNIVNKGDAECGMRVEFRALATVVNPSILNIYTDEFIKVKRTLEAGDKLIIDTNFGNKKVRMIKTNGEEINVFNWIDLESTFIQLEQGDNVLRYDAESGIDNLEVSIYYRPLYVGV